MTFEVKFLTWHLTKVTFLVCFVILIHASLEFGQNIVGQLHSSFSGILFYFILMIWLFLNSVALVAQIRFNFQTFIAETWYYLLKSLKMKLRFRYRAGSMFLTNFWLLELSFIPFFCLLSSIIIHVSKNKSVCGLLCHISLFSACRKWRNWFFSEIMQNKFSTFFFFQRYFLK